MSQLLETIAKELGPSVLAQVGSRVGANPQQTQAVATAAIPLLVAALAKNSSNPAGAQSLATALDRDHAPNLIDQLGPLAGLLGAAGGGGGGGGGGGAGGLAGLAGAMLGGGGGGGGAGGGLGALLGAAAGAMGGQSSAATPALPKALQGDKILGHVLGAERQTATQNVARASGVDANTVAALLPVLAPVVMSALGTHKKENGLDAGGLAGFLKGEAGGMGAAPRAGSAGFGADDLMKVGSALAQSGLLGKLFG